MTRATMQGRAQAVADEIFQQIDPQATELPAAALRRLHEEGFFTAPLPVRLGGQGLGTEAGGHRPLLRCLAAFGGADLALGRLYEGHVNALILIHAYGSRAQLQQAAADAHDGKLFGVWNTGEAIPMHLEPRGEQFALHGAKAFATGAGTVQRPIVTAEHGGWQMTLPRMDAPAIASHLQIDRSVWQPLGMQSSESYTIDFGGAPLEASDLIGRPGDMYRDPLFRGGAVRFAAVQTGVLLRLASLFTDWLKARGRHTDPYQLARRGEIELLAQGAALWIDAAADTAEACLWPVSSPGCTERMVFCGNTTRLAVERAANALMTHVIAGVGAHGLLPPARFARVLRDLTMYLRQPSPDAALADVGRGALAGVAQSYWRDPETPATVSDSAEINGPSASGMASQTVLAPSLSAR